MAEVVYSYTRKQAIEDGEQYLIDSKLSKDAGFNYPVYMTSAVHSLIERAVSNEDYCNDYNGVLWDFFTMMKHAIKTKSDSHIIKFRVIIKGLGRKKYYDFYLQCGPIDMDDHRPALTIMTEMDL